MIAKFKYDTIRFHTESDAYNVYGLFTQDQTEEILLILLKGSYKDNSTF